VARDTNSYFWFKMHTLVDKEKQFIRNITTSTASLHDSQVDLSEEGQTIYRDRGFFGVEPKASIDKTMDRATRNYPLSCKQIRRNKAISRIRSLIERPYAVIKRVFKGSHELVTTIERVRVKKCLFLLYIQSTA
jgi:transposase, IS5 family